MYDCLQLLRAHSRESLKNVPRVLNALLLCSMSYLHSLQIARLKYPTLEGLQ